MFERRLKIFLALLIAFTLLFLGRAFQVQLVGHHYWTVEADKATSDVDYLPTIRGRILDFKGRELAIDQPCIDACVDYRAIPLPGPDPEWLREQARQRVLDVRGDEYRRSTNTRRRQMLDEDTAALKDQVRQMWETLARESQQ